MSNCRAKLSAALSARVTLIAIDAVVDVSRNIVVLEIVGVVSAVASRALKDGIVVRIGVACRAHVIRVAVVGRELSILPVIERGSGPCCRVVAGLARGREELRLCRVSGIRRVVVISLVAADASRRQRGVVVIDVAIAALAWRDCVRSRQRERSVVVVEGGVGPDNRVMANLARSGESRGRVRGIGRACIILLMA